MQFDYTGCLCQLVGVAGFGPAMCLLLTVQDSKSRHLDQLMYTPKISYPHILKTKYSEKDSNLQPAPSSIPVLQILEKGDALSKIELSEHKKDSSMLYTGTSKR